ncbi:hypothetical protein [Burkholderia ubonensis]|uniref:hypothetical protein n=1 Tax=Burkholderia ubonensis TaxID=101571 RepID=UPI0012F72CE2|nr:hypothetical protein [Burkholderia ubonensis]
MRYGYSQWRVMHRWQVTTGDGRRAGAGNNQWRVMHRWQVTTGDGRRAGAGNNQWHVMYQWWVTTSGELKPQLALIARRL